MSTHTCYCFRVRPNPCPFFVRSDQHDGCARCKFDAPSHLDWDDLEEPARERAARQAAAR
jgi:hypothetical protein